MQLNCPSCAAVVAADDIDLPSATAKCRACNSLFSFRDRLSSPPPPLSREQVGLPERFFIEESDGAVIIRFSPSRGSAAFLIVFLVFWFGFLIVWNVIAISQGAWFMSAFSLLHILVGLGVAWVAAKTLFNTTEVRVDRARLQVKIGPVPTGGQVDLPSSSIAQVFCTATEHQNKGRRWHSYNVIAKTRDNREQPVLKGLETDRQALFIEQQIEKKLGIQDKPVAGELPK